jgi:hypothetical protein
MKAYVPPCDTGKKKNNKNIKKNQNSNNNSNSTGGSCSTGMTITDDTSGHCCWPGQTWGDGVGCVGIPSECPEGMSVKDQKCEPDACEGGRVRASDNLHCCWKGQAWSKSKSVCVGVPTTCPSNMALSGEDCIDTGSGQTNVVSGDAGCDEGRVMVKGHCCWSGQNWSSSGNRCTGNPNGCPASFVIDTAKQACVRLDAMGISAGVTKLSSADASRLGIAEALKVGHVGEGTPAALGGLEEGDLLLELNEHPLEGADGYTRALSANAHQLVLLKLSRNKETRLSTVRLP